MENMDTTVVLEETMMIEPVGQPSFKVVSSSSKEHSEIDPTRQSNHYMALADGGSGKSNN